MFREKLKSALAPALKPLGFKSKNLVWNRTRGEFVDVISIQTAKWSTATSKSITVNTGVAIPEFDNVVFGNSPSMWTEAQSLIRARPDELEFVARSSAHDKWWDITPHNVDERVEEIHRLILDKAVPFLDHFESFNEVATHLEHLVGWQSKFVGTQIGRALVLWKLGDPRFEEILAGPYASAWPEKVALVRQWIDGQAQSGREL